MTRIHSLAAALLTVAVAGGATAGAAQARGSHDPLRIAAPGHLAATGSGAQATRNPNFAAYEGRISTGVTSADTTVTVPSIKCPATGFDQTVIGTAIGDTTNDALSVVALNCLNGTAFYRLMVETDDALSPGGLVQPGDRVILSTNVTGSATFAQAVDRTRGVSLSANGGAPSSPADEYFAGLEGNAYGSLTPFSPVSFSSTQVNGAHLASLDPQRDSLISSAGDAFATHFSGPFVSSFTVYHRPGS